MSDHPNSHYCPITLDVMKDPVIDLDGNSYERSAIEKWLSNHNSSPMSRTLLKVSDLRPNIALKEAIREVSSKMKSQHVKPIPSNEDGRVGNSIAGFNFMSWNPFQSSSPSNPSNSNQTLSSARSPQSSQENVNNASIQTASNSSTGDDLLSSIKSLFSFTPPSFSPSLPEPVPPTSCLPCKVKSFEYPLNRKGLIMTLGRGQFSDVYYCGSSSNSLNGGLCGPDGDMQCNDCLDFNYMNVPLKTRYRHETKRSSVNIPINRQGFPMLVGTDRETFYCRRRELAERNRFELFNCGPDDGPQCQACKGFSRSPTSDANISSPMFQPSVSPMNRAGIPMTLGRGAFDRTYYCGRKLGVKKIPNSNGVCGPFNGPQCKDCAGFQKDNQCTIC